MKLFDFLNKNQGTIVAVGGILLILTTTGFNLNIVQFYQTLSLENKILFIGVLNIVFSTLLFSILSQKKNTAKSK